MPSTESPGSSSPLASLGRSIWSFRREQVHSMEKTQDSCAFESDLELFESRVAEQFQNLSSASNDELLSIPWIEKLLDTFLRSLDDFRALILKNRAEMAKPPLDRLTDEFFERSVKALDLCNAVRDGVEKLRQWQKHLEIVFLALDSHKRSGSEGQFRRARKALTDLTLAMLDERDSSSSSSGGSAFSHRNRSFGRHNNHNHRRQNSGSGSGAGSSHSRSLSWSFSHSWSAAKQLQSIAGNVAPPRGNGLAVTVFTMSFVLVFVLWALVAAIPCQDRGINVHFSAPKSFAWAAPMTNLQNRIIEESKKREHRNSNGLLREIHQLEICVRHASDLVDSVQFPLTDEVRVDLEERVEEISLVSKTFQVGLDPLERQIREAFRRIMACRTEGLDILSKGNEFE